MPYRIYFEELAELARSFNDSPVTLNINIVYQPIDYQLDEGLEVKLSEVEKKHELLSINKQQILLYIQDHSFRDRFEETLRRPKAGNRFHVAYCTTLRNMEVRNLFERYIATNNVSGIFTITDNNRVAQVRLLVCKNCLKLLNYKGFNNYQMQRTEAHKIKAAEIVRNFDLSEFFSTYGSFFRRMPTRVEQMRTNYPAGWSQISQQIKEQRAIFVNNVMSI